MINTNDSGLGSLRQAITTASSGDTIVFASGVTGAITLTSGELLINKNLTITGPGASILAVSGNNASRVFEISAGVTANISGLTVENGTDAGYGGVGGGIFNNGTLTLTNTTVSGNSAPNGAGGGIFNGVLGTLTLTNSTVSGNSANAAGGIFNYGTLTITNSTVADNSASAESGGILNDGTLTLTNSTVSGNSASAAGGGIANNGLGTLTITNSTVSGNSARTVGGGIFSIGPNTLTITNSTVAGNSASAAGGINNAGSILTIRSTLLASNGGGNCLFGFRNFNFAGLQSVG